MIFDSLRNTVYLSGFLHFEYPDKASRKVGNFVYHFNEGIILNSYVDEKKSERRLEDGHSDKTYISGIGREYGVRLFAEYDDEQSNRSALIRLDTSTQSIDLTISKNKNVTSSLKLMPGAIQMSHGIPLYPSTLMAAKDPQLCAGCIFKVSNGDGTMQVHIKEYQ